VASKIEIFNRALVILGEARVAAPTQDAKGAREQLAIWDTTRRSLLESYRWSFAMRRVGLAPLAASPAFGFTLQFLLPPDYLRLDFVEDFFVGIGSVDLRLGGEDPYSVEGSTGGMIILSDLANPLNIRYIADVTTTTHYNATFTEALAAKLALDAGWSITKNKTAVGKAQDAFNTAISTAWRVQAIERPPEQQPDTPWATVRR